jgi:NAD+ synthase
MKKHIEEVSGWLKNYAEKYGFKGFVLGLSGGIDSSVSLGLAVKAVGSENVKCYALSCTAKNEDSRNEDVEDAYLVAKTFCVKLDQKSLSYAVNDIFQLIENPGKLVLPNIKARLRMVTLRALAEANGYMVLGTTNKTEEYLGYYTKAGDGGAGVDIEPIADFFKFEIRELARELGVPEKIINKAPSAGLWFDQTDEDEIGFKYDDIDKYLTIREELTGKDDNKYDPYTLKFSPNGGISFNEKIDMIDVMPTLAKVKSLKIDPKLIERVETMIKSGHHKRNNPPYFKR